MFELCEMNDTQRLECMHIFNRIIEEGETYPWDEPLTEQVLADVWKPREPVWGAVDADGTVLGFAHIHPNGFGRTGHIANCGYAVDGTTRGMGIGKALVAKSIDVAREMGFKGIQFNAVVATNTVAVKLYESFGFSIIGTIPGGFRLGNNDTPTYVDRHIMYLEL